MTWDYVKQKNYLQNPTKIWKKKWHYQNDKDIVTIWELKQKGGTLPCSTIAESVYISEFRFCAAMCISANDHKRLGSINFMITDTF